MREIIFILFLSTTASASPHTGREASDSCAGIELDAAETKMILHATESNAPLSCVMYRPNLKSWCIEKAIDSVLSKHQSMRMGRCLIINLTLDTSYSRFVTRDQFVLIRGQ